MPAHPSVRTMSTTSDILDGTFVYWVSIFRPAWRKIDTQRMKHHHTYFAHDRLPSRAFTQLSGTCRRSSSSQTIAVASLGARQSPRGESDPPDPTFGPFGTAERLN